MLQCGDVFGRCLWYAQFDWWFMVRLIHTERNIRSIFNLSQKKLSQTFKRANARAMKNYIQMSIECKLFCAVFSNAQQRIIAIWFYSVSVASLIDYNNINIYYTSKTKQQNGSLFLVLSIGQYNYTHINLILCRAPFAFYDDPCIGYITDKSMYTFRTKLI